MKIFKWIFLVPLTPLIAVTMILGFTFEVLLEAFLCGRKLLWDLVKACE